MALSTTLVAAKEAWACAGLCRAGMDRVDNVATETEIDVLEPTAWLDGQLQVGTWLVLPNLAQHALNIRRLVDSDDPVPYTYLLVLCMNGVPGKDETWRTYLVDTQLRLLIWCRQNAKALPLRARPQQPDLEGGSLEGIWIFQERLGNAHLLEACVLEVHLLRVGILKV